MPGFNQRQKKIASFLIQLASKQDENDCTVSYHDLFRQITGLDPKYEYEKQKQEFEIIDLGGISYECIHLGLPILSTLVVQKEEGLPGRMYFVDFQKKLKKTDMPELDFWMEQFSAVRNTRSWKALEVSMSIQPSIRPETRKELRPSQAVKQLYHEGYKKHNELETSQRNREVVKAFKEDFVRRMGEHFCELCGERGQQYNGLRSSFFEAHHIVFFGSLDGVREVTIKDFILVCPNCHRICHLNPEKTIDVVKGIISSNNSPNTFTT